MGLETAADPAAEDMVLFEVAPAQRVYPPQVACDDPPAPVPEPLPDMTEPLPIPGWSLPTDRPRTTSTPAPSCVSEANDHGTRPAAEASTAPVTHAVGDTTDHHAHAAAETTSPTAQVTLSVSDTTDHEVHPAAGACPTGPATTPEPTGGRPSGTARRSGAGAAPRETSPAGAPAEAGAARDPAAITAAPMPAHLDPWEERVLADPDLLGDIAFAVGTPFHLMYPARVRRTIAEFQRAFTEAGVDGLVYYGKKANKAACVARACAEQGAGIDVSSVGELTAALAQGVRGDELMVTGPAKSAELLWLAARHGALIALDALDELARLTASGLAARVLLRALPDGSDSRFGMTGPELDRAVEILAGATPVRLAGFSFHLSGYDAAARSVLAAELVGRCLRAREHGHEITMLSIGGGFGVDYLSAAAWAEFTVGAGQSWFHAGHAFDSYYPYHFPVPGAAMLTAILAPGGPVSGGLGKMLRENHLRLAVEPGRALLAHAGSTVFGVRGAKTRHANGAAYRLLTVDGTSLSLSEQWFGSEYLPDPLLWPRRPATGPAPAPTPTSVGAASCLESDMLSWRRIPLPRPAEPGDLLIYPNTAGYQMDSNESAFHELPLPPKVVLHETEGDRLRWALDAR